jgi:methylated-DNA-[protein]-cysteine S-methyltransferase
MTELSWASLDTPVGVVSVGCTGAGVARVRYGRPAVPTQADGSAAPVSSASGGQWGVVPAGQNSGAAARLAETARTELIEYFRGDRRAFDVPIDWAPTAGPQRQVLTVLAQTVGYGETISYGALARRAGLSADPTPARVVGTIMAANPVAIIVPCHRVLASDGLGGYSGGTGVEVKRWLLILEGSHPPTLDWDAQGLSAIGGSGVVPPAHSSHRSTA